MGIQPYNKAQMGSLPGSDRRYVDQELLKIQTAIQSVENAFGPWIPYTPVVSTGAGALGSYTVNTARYQQIGKLVFFQADVLITNVGTASYDITISLPVGNGGGGLCVVSGRETIVTGKMLQAIISSNVASVFFYDNTFPGATNNRLVISGSYESI